MAGDSFVSNVNYIASLDNKYGKSITLDKDNVTMGVLSYDIVSTLTVYNQSTLVLDSTEVGNGSATSDTLDEYFALVVGSIQSAYPSIMPTASITPNGDDMHIVISLVGDELIRELNVTFTESGFEKYNLYGTIVNPVKVLPLVSQLDDRFIDGIYTVKDNIEDISAIGDLDPADISALGGVGPGLSEIADNIDDILLAADTVGLTVESNPVAYNVEASADYDNPTNTMTITIPAGNPGTDGLTPIYELDYNEISGIVTLVNVGYENVNGSETVIEW